ncbi:MAG: hypothetical protein R3C30_01930 [Hyphomonadaceae bacterium]
MLLRSLIAACVLTLLAIGSAVAQNPHLREVRSAASANAARFSALWLPDATVTILVALEVDRADGAAAFQAIYRIDCATNEPLAVAYEAFNAQGTSLGAIDAPPEDLAPSFTRLSWERPCRRDDIPAGFAVDPSPPPLFDATAYPPGLAQSVVEAITFTRAREAEYAEARQISPNGRWRRLEGLSTPGATYVERGDVEDGYRHIDLVFVPADPGSEDGFDAAPFAYERVVYQVACGVGRARILYRLRATSDHELAAYKDGSPVFTYRSFRHQAALSSACASTHGAEFNTLSEVLRDARAQ